MRLNEKFAKYISYLSHEVIPRDWQTLFFIKTEDQAKILQHVMNDETVIAMAKVLSDVERKTTTEDVRHNRIKRAICSDIYTQGVTFHELMCLINCSGGGASTSTIQKPGRLAEVRDGKTAALKIDFRFVLEGSGKDLFGKDDGGGLDKASEGVACMIRESQQRIKAYQDIGYEVHFIERRDEIKEWLAKQNIKGPK
jgi:superfamily II DNA/RNA helicase